MLYKLLILLAGLTAVASRSHVHFYRKDYTFFEDFDAFYKLHWDLNGLSWNSAFLACDDEGATLFYPKEADEWTVAKNLTASLLTPPNTTDIFIGIHNEFGLGEFITVDGHSTPAPLSEDSVVADGQNCTLMDVETGTYKMDSCLPDPDSLITVRPFVCKKVDSKPCPTIDSGYIYQKDAKKCYKVNNRPKVWQAAMHTCFMEGGILASVGSDAEAGIVMNLMPKNELYFTGFRRMTHGSFYTVKGQKLEESGYDRWYNREINEAQEDCGVIYEYSNTLYHKTNNCYTPLPFVCEMEAKA